MVLVCGVVRGGEEAVICYDESVVSASVRIHCVRGLLGGGCGGMERGCVGVENLRGMVKSSGGEVGLSIKKWG